MEATPGALPIAARDATPVPIETPSTPHHANWRTHHTKTPSAVLVRSQGKDMNISRFLIRHYVLSIEFQSLIGLAVITDIALIVGHILNPDVIDVDLVTLVHAVTLSLYSFELWLQLYAMGVRNFMRVPWHYVELAIIVQLWISIGLRWRFDENMMFILARGLLWFEEVASRIFPCVQTLRLKVSKNKCRYVDYEENFDLDLAYIAPDLIAMGVPTEGFRVLFRNPLYEVSRFFKLRHAGAFRIYNACPEIQYSDAPFEDAAGTVVRMQIQDHTPPTMRQFVEFLGDAREWVGKNKKKVIAVHCKAGKGRTGSLCCAWLMYSRQAKNTNEALRHFAQYRTDFRIGSKRQGVETPSQVRYVNQLWQFLQETDSWLTSPAPPPACPEPELYLHSMELVGGLIKKPQSIGTMKVLLQCGGGARPLELKFETPPVDAAAPSIDLGATAVAGDVRLSVFRGREADFSAHDAVVASVNASQTKGILFFLLFHTHFVPGGASPDAPRATASAAEAWLGAASPREGVPNTAQAPEYFRVPVESIDKASKQPKKYCPGSSLVLKYTRAGPGTV